MADNMEMTGIVEQRKELDNLLLSGGSEAEKEVRAIIKSVLKEFRNQLSQGIRSQLPNDPRQAYRAVKHMVYKRILGGNMSILSKKRAGKRGTVPPKADRGNKRGGNRIPRSQRTENLMSYQGSDRGFVLRFLNAGTDNRESRYGNRGSIASRNLFPINGHKAMEQAAERISQLIDKYIKEHTS